MAIDAIEALTPTEPDPPIVDSGIHVPDPEHAPASGWQITLAAVLVVAILSVFFYGVTNQRLEVAGAAPPSQQAANVPPAKTSPETTGQAEHDRPGAARARRRRRKPSH